MVEFKINPTVCRVYLDKALVYVIIAKKLLCLKGVPVPALLVLPNARYKGVVCNALSRDGNFHRYGVDNKYTRTTLQQKISRSSYCGKCQ